MVQSPILLRVAVRNSLRQELKHVPVRVDQTEALTFGFIALEPFSAPAECALALSR
jgi:hypothetical protein